MGKCMLNTDRDTYICFLNISVQRHSINIELAFHIIMSSNLKGRDSTRCWSVIVRNYVHSFNSCPISFLFPVVLFGVEGWLDAQFSMSVLKEGFHRENSGNTPQLALGFMF